MSFATEIDKQSTKRFVLMRVSPSRDVTTALASEGSGLYSVTLPDGAVPFSVTRNGTALTEVSSLVSNDQFLISGQLVRVKIASAPNATTNVVVVTYYLFFSSDEGTVTYQTPTDSATTKRMWAPRLASVPSFREQFTDILAGVFAIADTSFELANADTELLQFFTASDSWYEKAVEVWIAVTSADTSNVSRAYKGKVRSVDLSADQVSLTVFDAFSPMSQTAFMGDTRFEAFMLRESSGYPSMDPAKNGMPIRYFVGPTTRTMLSAPYAGFGSGIEIQTEVNIAATQNVAYCTTYDYPGTSANRTWVLGRTKAGVATQSFGAVQAVTEFAPAGSWIHFFRFASYSNVNVGDTFRFSQGGTTYYQLVERVASFTYSAVSYNLVAYPVANAITFSGGTVIATPSMSVAWRTSNGTIRWLLYGRDYTHSETATNGGNKLIKITLTNNFEANFGASALDPQVDQLYFRLIPSGAQGHATVMQDLVEKAGLTVNAASVTAAAAALTANACFSMPNVDESDYSSYQKYAQDLLASTFAYLRLNSSDEVEYKLLSAPSSGDEVTADIHLGGLACSIDYQDIITEIVAQNPHAMVNGSSSGITTAENVAAKYLHGIKRTDQMRHALDDISGRIATILAVKSRRRTTYKFKVATALLGHKLGDDVTLTSDLLPGGVATDNLKLTSIDKSVDEVAVEAIDLEGL